MNSDEYCKLKSELLFNRALIWVLIGMVDLVADHPQLAAIAVFFSIWYIIRAAVIS